VAEDFRGEILGFLGSSPNYQELYRKALVDRDYRRTAEELDQMVQTAAVASQALQSLAQDLTAFNLEHYRKLQGELTLEDLRTFMEAGILRLGGTFIPDGDFYRIETPPVLLGYRNVASRYDSACFNRKVAMRRKNADFMGIGHPLLDGMIAYLQQSSWAGEVTMLKNADPSPCLSVRFILEATLENGSIRRRYGSAETTTLGSWNTRSPKSDINSLDQQAGASPICQPTEFLQMRDRVMSAIADAEAQFRSELPAVQTTRIRLAGLAAMMA